MKQKEFKQAFFEQLQQRMDTQGGKLEWRSFPKNNRIREGIVIHQGNHPISGVVFPDDFYEMYLQGRAMDEILNISMNSFEQVSPLQLDFFQSSKEDILKQCRIFVIGAKNNKALLETCPHEVQLDLALCVKWSHENHSVTVTDHFMEHFDISREELFSHGHHNLCKDIVFRSMNAEMKALFSEEMEPELEFLFEESKDDPFFILSTKDRMFGAGLMLEESVLTKIREQLDSDFYILPSSVHECLIVGKNGEISANQLLDMVVSVNETELAPEEKLTDQVYEYAGGTLTIAAYEEPSMESITQDGYQGM